jgi:hypothetical protein
VDAALFPRTLQDDPANIKSVIAVSRSVGLRAVYEVVDEATAVKIRKATGLSAAEVMSPGIDPVTGKPWITGPHFSIYQK